ncbi:MAG: hypothetical protein ACP5K9_02355 [Candidatus Micrarchaeia archaeon]
MDHWKAINEASMAGSFSKERFYAGTGGSVRSHSSLSMISDKAKFVEKGEMTFDKYDPLGLRYVAAKSIEDDLFLSIYNLNSMEIVAFRPTKMPQKKEKEALEKYLRRFSRPNIEIRAIGMLNGNAEMLRLVEEVRKLTKGSVVEADLFGDEYRHIVIDLKTGSSYDLLLEDRIYRPGELKIQNTQTPKA